MRTDPKLVLIGLGALLAAAAVLPVSCGGPTDPWKGLAGPPRVVATFPPLACFAENVGGNPVGVLTLCTSKGPHEFDPSPQDTYKLRKADLFLLNGLTLDDKFAREMARASDNPRLRDADAPGLVNLGDRLLAMPGDLVDPFGEHGDHNHDHEHGHAHGQYDPHVWLGVPQAVAMVEVIRDELKKVDPSRAADYDRRAADYVARLEKLHREGKAELAGKKNRRIVTAHESLHYFAESFDIDVVGAIQLTPGQDPDAQTLDRLARTCQEKDVHVIATEPQFRQRGAAETLQQNLRRKGVDVELIELDPLETLSADDKLDAGWYERRLRANLDTLKKALP
jgi:ABC-type Zn uptake system ZnuABC Zn-binding protein ZnuA